tara:strand:- start:704 stop:1279 length:576 start_codon:yes stop_codon:yes gene_type:complete
MNGNINDMQVINMELTKRHVDFEKRFEARINVTVKQAIQNCEDYIHKQVMKVNERTCKEGKELSNAVLTKRVCDSEAQIIDLKRHSNPYVLSEQVRQLHEKVNTVIAELNYIRSRQNIMDSDKFIDTSITPEELRKLYASSGCSQGEMAKFLNVDKSRFYQIINGQETNVDWVRRNKLKRYFLKKIHDASS